MYADRRDHRVAFRINHADVARPRIHRVNLVLLAIRRNSGRLAANFNGLRGLKRSQIDDANRIALAIGDVGVLVISRAVVGELALVEIQPPNGNSNGRGDNDEKKLSQVSGAMDPRAGSEETDEIAFGRAGTGGTVLPTTGAICRTCTINSSN